MRKFLLYFLAVLSMHSPHSRAGEAEATPSPAIHFELSVWSAYVSRGQVNNDEPVLQPSLRVAVGRWHGEVWGNLDITDTGPTGRGEFSEINMIFGLEHVFEFARINLDYAELIFPGNDAPLNREVLLGIELDFGRLRPFAEAVYEFEYADGFYISAGAEWLAVEKAAFEIHLGLSSGWGSRRYNHAFFEIDRSEWNDLHAYTRADFALGERGTLSILAGYSTLWNSALRQAARDIYADEAALYGGLALGLAL